MTTYPGDNNRAERARDRKKAGLGLAGVGYLAASRSGDVAPGAADLITGGKKVGGDAREAKLAARAAHLKRWSGRGGAAMVGLGLAGAGEGMVSDLHQRKVLQRTKKQVQDQLTDRGLIKSAFGVEDYRVAKSDKTRERAQGASGAALIAGGAGAQYGAHRMGSHAGRLQQEAAHYAEKAKNPPLRGIGSVYDHVAHIRAHSAANLLRDARQLRRGGYAGAALGAGLVAAGVSNRNARLRRESARLQDDRVAKATQRAQRARNASIGKSAYWIDDTEIVKALPGSRAFDSEEQRHKRQTLYTGGAAGGTVVAGGGAATMGAMSFRRARTARKTAGQAGEHAAEAHQRIIRLGKPATAADAMPRTMKNIGDTERLYTSAWKKAEDAKRLGRTARRLRGGALGATAAGLGLAGAAVGIHRSDQQGRGRSYVGY